MWYLARLLPLFLYCIADDPKIYAVISTLTANATIEAMWYLARLLPLFLYCIADDPKIYAVISTLTANATIEGYNHPYGNSWRGIPYAQAPIGDLRFQNAVRRDPAGSMKALGYGSSCSQGTSSGSEDCLFLNVFTSTKTSLTARLPVYVWVHGGGFIEGSGNMGADIYPLLVDKGPMVLVSINYRLGPFGFFSTRHSGTPGNWAVSDWIEALNWVQRYISFFGGDPSKVTLGGQSSGAEAVSFVSLIKQANDLYNQLILESGSAFGAAVMSYKESTRNTSAQLSFKTNCGTSSQWADGNDFDPIVKCLRGLTQQQLMDADNSLPNHRMKWAPVQDSVFFPGRLEYAAEARKKVPVLIGDVHDEWLGWEMWNVEHNLNSSQFTQNGLANTLRNSYEMTYWNDPNAVLQGANDVYIYDQNIASDDHVMWMAQQIRLYSEMVFIGPVFRDAQYFAYTGSDVYLYSFDYLSPLALPQITQPQLRGIPHSWELSYIFSKSCNGYECQENDEILRNLTTSAWTNFITQGSPTPTGSGLSFYWPKLANTGRYLSLQPYPATNINFHPTCNYWACTAPSIDGYRPPFC